VDKLTMMITARKLFRDTTDLPTIPAIVSKVVSMLDDPNSNPDEIADLMLSDVVLTAKVLKVVNSPLYRTANSIDSVKRALIFLGFKCVREMILTSYFVDGFKDRDQPFNMKAFWTHSFSVGAISRFIARKVNYSDMEKAYLVGIVHDIGKVFLGHYCKDEYGRMLQSIENTSNTTYDAEYEFFGTTHCEVGLCLAQRWNFPSVYSDVISYHHSSKLATEDPFLTAIITLADFYCSSHVTAESVAQASIPGDSEENAWDILTEHAPVDIAPSMEHFLTELDEAYEEVSQEVAVIFNTMVV